MADEPISALTLFTSYSTADEVEILDVSDTTFASTGTNKRIPFSTLLTMAGVGSVAGGGTGLTAVGSADQLLGVAAPAGPSSTRHSPLDRTSLSRQRQARSRLPRRQRRWPVPTPTGLPAMARQTTPPPKMPPSPLAWTSGSPRARSISHGEATSWARDRFSTVMGRPSCWPTRSARCALRRSTAAAIR